MSYVAGYSSSAVDPVRVAGGIRWGAIIAGLFTAMSTTIVLGALGVATGLASVDAGDRARSFGIGAGIWGAVTALVAFAVGGFVAARSAGLRGTGTGAFQGAMVWIVAIPLLMYVLVGGVGSLVGTAGSAAATGVQATASAAPAASDLNTKSTDELKNDVKATTRQAAGELREQADKIRAAVTPQKIEQAADKAAGGAWGVLASLLLGLAASAVGGFLGSRGRTAVVA